MNPTVGDLLPADGKASRRLRVAFIVQRYGLEVNGGSEALCRMIAERMARYHDVEVLTTRAIDYVTWRDEYREAVSDLNGVRIRRFGVDFTRSSKDFDAASARVFGGAHAFKDEIEWMRAQGPYSSGLLHYLEANRQQYDVFVFFTYLYATTYFGLPLVQDRAALVPTCHDEPPIYLKIFDFLFQQVPYFIFLTPEERAFARRRFYHCDLEGAVVGTGVDIVENLPGDAEWTTIDQRLAGSEFVLYVGRIDESKGCKTLLDYFCRYIDETKNRTLKLVLMGKPVMPIPEHLQVLQTGFVSEMTKLHAIQRCRFMVAPSPYESLCISVLEAWSMKRPVLANGDCAVLRGQCGRSNGGLWYFDYEEFCETACTLLHNLELAETLGAQGFEFVESHCIWSRIELRYLEILSSLSDRPARALPVAQ